MALKKYDAVVNGMRTTLRLKPEEAARRGLTQTPANKTRRAPANRQGGKAAKSSAPPPPADPSLAGTPPGDPNTGETENPGSESGSAASEE